MNISLPPELNSFVEKKVKNGIYANESEVVNDALRFLKEKDGRTAPNELPLPGIVNLSSLGDSDTEALVFTVLKDAMKSADKDLKDVMRKVKAINNAKAKYRELISHVNNDIGANAGQRDRKSPLDFSSGLGSEEEYHHVKMPVADSESESSVKFVLTDLYIGKIEDVDQLEEIRDELEDKLESMDEMSDMTLLRLQMAMDRRSKLLSTLSNILKKIRDTQDTLVQNLK